jgi:hypothetical protein
MGLRAGFSEEAAALSQTQATACAAGRYYLTKSDLNAPYFATYELPRMFEVGDGLIQLD